MPGTIDALSCPPLAPPRRIESRGAGVSGTGGKAMLRTAIIIGSIRPGRKAESVANWIYQVASKRQDAEFELVDLQSFGLPFAEEPGQSRPNTSRPPATLAWA